MTETTVLQEEIIATPRPMTPYARALSCLQDGPSDILLVFDCDWTLYPYDCDKERMAPFSHLAWSGVHDCHWRSANSFPDVPGIFGAIADAGIPVAFLSRNSCAESLEDLLRTLPCDSKGITAAKNLWDTMPSPHYFHAYSNNGIGKGKDRHFAALKAVSGISFSNMLFFDDKEENIDAAVTQGSTSVHLDKLGLTVDAFITGIDGWRKDACF
uniref:Magnesium-dependent phosphatase-1 n=1 Tax=viral metagenome TaxID=1070528 RepID=A0A6C0AMA8_9ZZZZ